MPTIAIILGRAGSKGVPGKNTRIIANKPCVAWTIEHALRSKTVNHVVVSSDDPNMLAIAKSKGALPMQRPPDLATDTARVDDAARHAALEAAAHFRHQGPDRAKINLVILYANVPVRPDDLTDRAVTLLQNSKCDSVQSYQPVGKYHPWWIARVDDKSGQVAPWEGDVLNHNVFRRQDLPPAHIPDGGVIAVTWNSLFCAIPKAQPGPHQFFGVDRRGVLNPEGSVIDIDRPEDVLVAEAILRSTIG